MEPSKRNFIAIVVESAFDERETRELADAQQPEAAPSTTSDKPMVIERRTTCINSAPLGHRVSSIRFSSAATSPIAPAAAPMRTNALTIGRREFRAARLSR